MNIFKGIDYQGVFYSEGRLKTSGQQLADNSEDVLLKQIFAFCSAWLNDQAAFLVSTSGSTGEPKQITLMRQQMELSAKMTGEALQLSPGDRALLCLSPHYIAGMMMLVRAMTLGLQITITAPTSNPFSAQVIRSKSFDFTAIVPVQLQTIMEQGFGEHLEIMKAVLVGGADISPLLADEARKLQCALYQTFGMTETATHIALRRLDGSSVSKYYKKLSGITIGQDERDCLTVQGAITNHKLLISNDVVELKSDSEFRWLGRIDHMINSGGIKILPEELEYKIARIITSEKIDLGPCMVVGVPDERLGQRVAVVFEGPIIRARQKELLLQGFESCLDKYERPRLVYNLEKFARHLNGKIDRKQTLQLLISGK